MSDKKIFADNDIEAFENKLKKIVKPKENWAIYGSGNGAELIFAALCKLSAVFSIKYIIERDEFVHCKKEFHGIGIKKLSEVCDELDGIIVAAMDNHNIIYERILKNLTKKQLKKLRVVDIFTYNTSEEIEEYVSYIEKSIFRKSEEFIAFDNHCYKKKKGDTKVIAWYLPQFHQMEINNKFHGKGFTEWTNTSRAIPLFTGHYQPHIPYDVGYYDLLNIDTLKRQIYLAKHYGIYGFSFHYYWFSGKRIMEKPLELLLEHKELDIPFCINWATENWTALWDGGNNDVMLEQKLDDKDDEKFMDDILPYMKDSRYIKIDGRPVLVVYRVNTFEQKRVKRLFSNFRNRAKSEGFFGLYIVLTNSFDFDEDVAAWGADAFVEFPIHGMWKFMDLCRPKGYLNPYFKGKIRDASSFVKNRNYMLKHKSKIYFRSALVSWDNTARKALSNGTVYIGFTPETFRQWLTDIVTESKKIHSDEEDIVFVNSWNEWAEGSHLEPDMKYGYAYLQVVKDVLETYKQ